jgi:hypothetical protein
MDWRYFYSSSKYDCHTLVLASLIVEPQVWGMLRNLQEGGRTIGFYMERQFSQLLQGCDSKLIQPGEQMPTQTRDNLCLYTKKI